MDTLVFLMGVGRTQHIAEELIRYGKSADTPAAFVRWGTRPYQETYTTTLGEAAEAVKKYGIKPPSVFIVGNVSTFASNCAGMTISRFSESMWSLPVPARRLPG